MSTAISNLSLDSTAVEHSITSFISASHQLSRWLNIPSEILNHGPPIRSPVSYPSCRHTHTASAVRFVVMTLPTRCKTPSNNTVSTPNRPSYRFKYSCGVWKSSVNATVKINAVRNYNELDEVTTHYSKLGRNAQPKKLLKLPPSAQLSITASCPEKSCGVSIVPVL